MKTTVRYILTDEPPRHSSSPQRRDEIADLKAQCRTLGEKVLEEQRMRYEVEREDAVALTEMKAQGDALADALIERMDATLPKYWRTWDGELNDENDRSGHYRRLFAALRAAGRLPVKQRKESPQ